MKHTIYSHVIRNGDVLTLRTSGVEGLVEIPLSKVRKVKFPFPCVTIETDDRTYRLDLQDIDPCEYAEAKTILTDALRMNHRADATTDAIERTQKGNDHD